MSISVSSHVLSEGVIRCLGLRNSGDLCCDSFLPADLGP